MNSEPKTDRFFFFSFGIEGLKNLNKQDNKKIIDKILNGIEKKTRTDKRNVDGTLYNSEFTLTSCLQIRSDHIKLAIT